MADTIRRVYEIDAKLSTTALQSLREIQKNLKEVGDAAGEAGRKTKAGSKDIHDAAGAFDKLNFATVGARRELLVLIHEASQGNFKQFGGSLLVLGERIDATSLIMSKAGLATIGLVGILALLGSAFIHAALAHDEFNKKLTLTGNQAGVSSSNLRTLSESVADSTGNTIGHVKQLIELSATSGQVGAKLIGPLTEAMSQFQRLSGESVDKVGKTFADLAHDPTKGALELNRTINFLTASTYELIKRTQQVGDVEAAAVIAADAVSAALKNRQAPALSFVGELWEALKLGIDRTKDSLTGLLRAETGVEKIKDLYKELESAQKKVDDINKSGNAFSKQGLGAAQAQVDAIKGSISAQIRANADENSEAAEKQRTGRIHKLAVDAQVERDIFLDSIKGNERYNRQIEKFTKERDAIVAERKLANPSYDPDKDTKFQQENAIILQKIREQNRTKGDKALESATQARLRSLGEEDAALREQIAQYDLYGKKLNNAARAKLEFDLADGKLKGTGAANAAELRKRADDVDKHAQELRQLADGEAIDKRITQLKAEAEAGGENARQKAIGIEVGKLEASELDKNTPKYAERRAALIKYTEAVHDNALARKLAANEAATKEQAAALDEETALIGKSTLERKQATESLKLYKQARKEIVENPGKEAEILASTARQVDVLTTALERNYIEQRKFESGAKEAFAKYIEDAGNGAAFATQLIGGGLKQVEDIFVNFAKTGKLSFTGLFQFMVDEFLRQSVKMTLKGILEDKDSQSAITGALQSIGKVFGIDFGSKAGGAAGASGAVSADAALATFSATTDSAYLSMDVFSGSVDSTALSLDDLILSIKLAGTALDGLAGSGGGAGVGSAAGSAASSFDFSSLADFFAANGGIMSKYGPLALNTYSRGGIADKPQMAIFGEGRMNEAYVPLPDGKTIPVNLRTSQESKQSDGTMIVIENHNGSEVSAKREKRSDGREQVRVMVHAAKQAILEDIYGGGEVDRAFSNKYGVNRQTARLGT